MFLHLRSLPLKLTLKHRGTRAEDATGVGEEVERPEPFHCRWGYKVCITYRKQCDSSSGSETGFVCDLAIPLQVYAPKQLKAETRVFLHMFLRALFYSQKAGLKSKAPSAGEWINKIGLVQDTGILLNCRRIKVEACYNVDEPQRHARGKHLAYRLCCLEHSYSISSTRIQVLTALPIPASSHVHPGR